MLKIIINFLAFTILTILTQVGGFVYLISYLIAKRLRFNRIKSLGLFIGMYLLASLAIIPVLAPFFGRTALPISGNLRPLNIVTCLLNRHYVKPELKDQLVRISNQMNIKFAGTKTNYLDANFPFYNGYPLIPHLSHNDGKKVDLAFLYINARTHERNNSAPSFIGYGIYDGATEEEVNYPQQCSDKGFWQYGFLGHIVPKWKEDQYTVDQERTKEIIRLLATDQLTSKIFIEPHLKQRWNLSSYENIRYHGCQAVRHDDHIHTQIK
jgi:hypothetical protein